MNYTRMPANEAREYACRCVIEIMSGGDADFWNWARKQWIACAEFNAQRGSGK